MPRRNIPRLACRGVILGVSGSERRKLDGTPSTRFEGTLPRPSSSLADVEKNGSLGTPPKRPGRRNWGWGRKDQRVSMGKSEGGYNIFGQVSLNPRTTGIRQIRGDRDWIESDSWLGPRHTGTSTSAPSNNKDDSPDCSIEGTGQCSGRGASLLSLYRGWSSLGSNVT